MRNLVLRTLGAAVCAVVVLAVAMFGAPSARAADGPIKIALVLPARVNDPGYYNAGYQALLAAKETYGAEIAYQENLKAADAEQVLRVFADDGFNYVVVMGGGNYDDQIKNVAKDYPEMKFIIISGVFTQLPNIVSIRTSNPGVAYLAGIVMADLSRSGKLGLIGGRATPPSVADHVAIIAGARSVRPDVQILDVYTENFENPAIGKEAALAQIEQGVDMIYANANTTSFGVFQAAQERRILAVGAATDQNDIAPNTIVTSTVYGMDTALRHLIDLDRGAGWEDKIYTLDMSMVNIAPFHALDAKVSPETKQKLEAARKGMLDGSITVPTKYEQINMEAPVKK